MSFESSIKAFEQKALLAANKSVCKVFETVSRSTVALSPSSTSTRVAPYATNLLVNQWKASVKTPSGELTSSTNPTGADSLASINALVATLPFYKKDNSVFLTNNTEEANYAEVLGWTKGAGTNGWVWAGAPAYGMIAKSVAITKAEYL